MKINRENGIWRLVLDGKTYPCISLSDVFMIIKIKNEIRKTAKTGVKG